MEQTTKAEPILGKFKGLWRPLWQLILALGSGHKVQLMKYMVIESFKSGMSDAVYARFQAKGRMLPDDLEYLDSWVSADRTKCFQLMQTDDPGLFANWTALWNDLIGRGPGSDLSKLLE